LLNPDLQKGRRFLRDTIRQDIDFGRTDQVIGVTHPPVQKSCPDNLPRIVLPRKKEFAKFIEADIVTLINRRRSHRHYTDMPLTLTELAFLLWATQGISLDRRPHSLRTVPSAGARHPFETYICVQGVSDLEEGLYRYLPLDHALVNMRCADLRTELVVGTMGQSFVSQAAVVFVWTAIPHRAEWRYGAAAHKTIAIDAGHVCQNLYLACGAINAGTCAIAAYDQTRMDALLNVDGEDEFTIYMAPVGKI